uniref:Uncharacterized protein n=1 Tax=Panthera leo TaxID=9689 RepID=A0A8C9DCR1_PANLE
TATVFVRKMMLSALNLLLHQNHFPLQVCWCKAQHGMATVALLLPIHLLPKLQLTLWFKTKGVIKEPCRDCLLGEEAWALVHLLKNKPKHKQRQMEFLSL